MKSTLGALRIPLEITPNCRFFKQGTNEVIPDSIRFNFDTQKLLFGTPERSSRQVWDNWEAMQ